jgi:glycosyltransferase involved in cell wall biosynthesis
LKIYKLFFKEMAKRILIFSIAYPPFVGGAEVAIKEITDRVEGVEFDLITLRFDSALPAFERVGKVDVYRIGFTAKNAKMADLVRWPLKLNKFLFPLSAAFKAWSLNRKRHYNGIWAMMAAYAGFAAMVYKLINPRVPYLLTLQEGDPIDEIKGKVRYVYPLFQRIFSSAEHVQAISHYLADFARGMNYGGPITVVPNAVDVAHFSQEYPAAELDGLKSKLGKATDDIYVITTSRLVPKNGINDVISALKDLPARVKFLILGVGPDEAAYKALASELGVAERVLWLGFMDHKEIPKYLKISDTFIRPSLSEGLGNSFLEAMAAGLPVIATPVGGIPDFLFDPEKNPDRPATGLFCGVKDPASIARQIQRLIDDKELRDRLVQNGQALVREKYDWTIIAKDMEKVFDQLLAK